MNRFYDIVFASLGNAAFRERSQVHSEEFATLAAFFSLRVDPY